jgi:hypothetical protein
MFQGEEKEKGKCGNLVWDQMPQLYLPSYPLSSLFSMLSSLISAELPMVPRHKFSAPLNNILRDPGLFC